MIKISLHSVTDLITNSSTVIFTYSEGSVKALKEMINEILKTLGVENLKCDDMFDTVVMSTDSYTYSEWISELDREDWPEEINDDTDIDQIFKDVVSGKIEKPKWFDDAEKSTSSYDYYTPSTSLYLIPKDEKYRKMGELIKTFLYSTDHSATYDD